MASLDELGQAVQFSLGQGGVVLLPLASVVVRWLTTMAAVRRLTVPTALRHAHGLIHLVVGDLLAPAVGVATAAIGGLQRAAGGVDGAVAGTGGWLLAAPGTPVGWAGWRCSASLVWLPGTVAVALLPWLGRYSSAVLSTWEKSMSALTVLRSCRARRRAPAGRRCACCSRPRSGACSAAAGRRGRRSGRCWIRTAGRRLVQHADVAVHGGHGLATVLVMPAIWLRSSA